MKIIAFSGKATCGKTAAAILLGEGLMYDGLFFRKVSFADALRKMVIDWFPVDIVDLKNRKSETIKLGDRELTIRQLLIEVGCKMREIQPDFWVEALWKHIEYLEQSRSSFSEASCEESVYAVDDMRFPNEYDLFKKKGGLMIRIERPGVKLIEDISETSLDDHEFDHHIENNGSLDELRVMVQMACGDYLHSVKSAS